MMSAKAKKLAPPQVILVPMWALPTENYRSFKARVAELAGGYTTMQVHGAWQKMEAEFETSERLEARVSMHNYENDTRLDRSFDDFARFLLTREHEVYRERGPVAWIEPR